MKFFQTLYFSYRWLKNGKDFNFQVFDPRISQMPGQGTLIFNMPRPEDEGFYQCFAENSQGIASSNSVHVRKSFLNDFKQILPITKTVEEGKPFTLTCDAPDGLPKPSLYWMYQVNARIYVEGWTT